MPSGHLEKYRCKEVGCNLTVRSDKWNEHVKTKHKYKYKMNLRVPFSVLEVRQDGKWKKVKSPCQVQPQPSTSKEEHNERNDCVNPDLTEKTSDETIMDDDEQEDSNQTTEPLTETTKDSEMPDSDGTEKNAQQSTSFTASRSSSSHSSSDDPISHSNIERFADPADFAESKLSPESINLIIQQRKQMELAHWPDLFPRADWNYKEVAGTSPLASKKSLRSWIIYSEKKKSIYCFPCVLFSTPSSKPLTVALSQKGFDDWNNACRQLPKHEMSDDHRNNELALLRWFTGQRIDKSLITSQNALVEFHRSVLNVIIDCCRYLASEMIAFRRAEFTEGKLFKLFSLLSKYDTNANQYLQKILEIRSQQKKMEVNFLSFRSIHKIIESMKTLTLNVITSRVKESKATSLIFDSTQDVSKMEASVLLLRYLEDVKVNDMLMLQKPVERLVGAFTSGKTSGENLFNEVKKLLIKLDIDFDIVIGQSYDGAGNMSGQYQGMRSHVQKECSQALYVWCSAHRFALVVEKSLESSVKVKSFLGTLEELYVFMNGHRRHEVFVKCVENSSKPNIGTRRLKRVATTRWNSKFDACSTLFICYKETIECLSAIINDKTIDKTSISSALGLKKKLQSYDFSAALIICLNVFKMLAPVSKALQGSAIDLGAVKYLINGTMEKLNELREDKSWKTIEKEILAFNSEQSIEAVGEKRIGKPKRFMDELGIEYYTEPSNKLEAVKIKLFYPMIDHLKLQLNDRFDKNSIDLYNEIGNFTHLSLLSKQRNRSEIEVSMKKISENFHIDAFKLADEFAVFLTIYRQSEKDINVSDLLPERKKTQKKQNEVGEYEEEEDVDEKGATDDVEDQAHEREDSWIVYGFIKPFRLVSQLSSFPTLEVLYKILITLPVSSCSAERSLSKLNIVKNRLRASMKDEWMEGMMVLACESDIMNDIPNEKVIDHLALSSPKFSKYLLFK